MPHGPYYDPENMIVIEVSLAESDAVWDRCQGPIGKSQKISLEFWRKTLSSFAENYCPIVRHILPYYYECLIMDHKVIIRTKLPVKSWELSNQEY